MNGAETVHIALAVAVEDDRFCLVRQYRAALGRRTWEFASGTLEETDEDAAAAAARELREETGLSASTWRPLGIFDVAPGNMDLRCHAFLANDLLHADATPDPEEGDLHAEWFSTAQLKEMIQAGTFCDAKSLAAYSLLVLRRQY